MPRDRDDDRDDRDDRDDDRPRRRYDDEDDRPRRRRYDDDDPPPKRGGSAGIWIALGVVAAVVFICGGVALVLLLPAVQKVRDASARMQTSNNLKQLTLGAHNYDSAYSKLPAPFAERGMTGPAPANWSDRLSWRYELLPYIEQDNLYKVIDAGQAWNSTANRPYTGTPIKVFGDTLDPPEPNTRFRCFYDNGALFSTDPKERVSISGVKDGTANTIMFIETTDLVPWAQFNELKFEPNGPLPQLGHPKREVILIGMADGSIKTVKKSVNPNTLKAGITRAGNEGITDPDW